MLVLPPSHDHLQRLTVMFFRDREASASKQDAKDGVLDTASSVKLGLSTEVVVDEARVQAEERRLKRKFDWLLLPPLTVMCVFTSFIQR